MKATIDLRSDTVTKPSAGMRRAMADADVGDDVLDGDPTTRLLEERMAEIFGTESALFFPSGTQSNQTAVWALTQPGTELVLEANAHIIHYEIAGAAALAGVQVRPVTTPNGILTAELAAAAIRPTSPHTPEVSALAAENTHNAAGGKVMSLADWDKLVALAQQRQLPLHLDGARLWHAAVAQGAAIARTGQGATTITACLSKGMGCPVGSCLMSNREVIDRARRIRRRLGGAMRQSGVLAAAGLYALDHNIERLAEDHANAALFADRLRDHPVVEPLEPDTNIVMLDLIDPDLTAETALSRLAEAGVLMVPFSPTRLRAVTHLDVTADQVATAAEIVARTLAPEGG
ncbi:MAG: aminotransferase class I/II-fold pyridoxal phosphate-dependent enzyme [Gemmatimonadota bacterium]|nr:MAG: aminotransferase class I/II-fold pyridoxal phosphate-dependent enzyme [Gemmatimonadota bacterium]